MKKRILSMLLALLMIFSMLPVSVLADDPVPLEPAAPTEPATPEPPAAPAAPETPAEPEPHTHDYTYTSNGNGSHTGKCACGDRVAALACVDEEEPYLVCDVCGADLRSLMDEVDPLDDAVPTLSSDVLGSIKVKVICETAGTDEQTVSLTDGLTDGGTPYSVSEATKAATDDFYTVTVKITNPSAYYKTGHVKGTGTDVTELKIQINGAGKLYIATETYEFKLYTKHEVQEEETPATSTPVYVYVTPVDSNGDPISKTALNRSGFMAPSNDYVPYGKYSTDTVYTGSSSYSKNLLTEAVGTAVLADFPAATSFAYHSDIGAAFKNIFSSINWIALKYQNSKHAGYSADGTTTAFHLDGKLPFFNVSFDTNDPTGTTVTMDDMDGYYYNKETITLPTPTCSNPSYKFLGWKVVETPTEFPGGADAAMLRTSRASNLKGSYEVSRDVMLEAQWEASYNVYAYILPVNSSGDALAKLILGSPVNMQLSSDVLSRVGLKYNDTEKLDFFTYGSTVLHSVPSITNFTSATDFTLHADSKSFKYGSQIVWETLTKKNAATDFPGYSDTAKANDYRLGGTLTFYKVSFDANTTDTVTGIPEGGYYLATETFKLPATEPQREGYDFVGWQLSTKETSALGQKKAGETVTVPAADLTLTAQWEKKVLTVKFRPTNGEKDWTEQVTYGSSVTLTKPEMDGYEFAGWFIDNDLTKEFVATSIVTQDLDLYARWDKLLTLTYNKNTTDDVVGMPDSVTQKSNDFTVSTATPTREGYTFLGWSLDKEGKNLITTTIINNNQSFTLYAIWQKNTFTVTFYPAGGQDSEGGHKTSWTETIGYGETIDFVTLTQEGYEFVGWFLADDLTKEFKSTDTVKQDLVLQARWVKLITLTYDKNTTDDVDGMPTSVTQKSNDFTVSTATPTREGYTFKGWSLDKEGKNLITTTIISNNQSFTLYAIWEAVNYNITYILNDGDAKHTNPATYTVEDEITLVDATNGSFGRKFVKWVDEDGNAVTKIEKGTTGDITLTAVWANRVTYYIVDAAGTATQYGDPVYVTVGDTHTPTDAEPKTGYTFNGWYQSAKDFGSPSKKLTSYEANNSKLELKLYGQYVPVTYTITYDFRDKDITDKTDRQPTNPTTYTIETETFSINPITADGEHGKKFLEWRDKDGNVVTEITKGSYGDITLYAYWQYPVKYHFLDKNGNELTELATTQYFAEDAYASYTLLTAPEKTGHSFDGWYEFAGDIGNADKKLASVTAKKYELYGKYSPLTYNIAATMYLNGSADAYKGSLSYPWSYRYGDEYGETIDYQPMIDAIKAKALEADAANNPNTSKVDVALCYPGSFTSFDTAVTTYGQDTATWQTANKNTAYIWARVYTYYDLTFVTGTADTIPAQLIRSGDLATEPSAALSKTHYNFTGWYTDEDCTEKFDFTSPVTKSMTLYAGWEPIVYNVFVNATRNNDKNQHAWAATLTGTCEDNLLDLLNTKITADYLAKFWASKNNTSFVGYTADLSKFYDWNTGNEITSEQTVAGEQWVYLNYDPNTYTVVFDKNDSGATGEMLPQSFTYDAAQALTENGFAKTGYYFDGWNTERDGSGTAYADKESVMNLTSEDGATVTLYAQWKIRTDITYTVHYYKKGTEKSLKDDKIVTDQTFGTTVTEEAAKISGWRLVGKAKQELTLAESGNEIVFEYVRKTSSSKPVSTTPTLKFNTSDHDAYIKGYPDGTVKPHGTITRAEVATILYRIMDEDCREAYYTTKNSFYDVNSSKWYNTYVSTLANAGVIVDSSNGYFRPDEAITRAELAVMMAQFTSTTASTNNFTDVSRYHWAATEIAVAEKMGWIKGYPDGTFRPDATITRAEMVTMINRALDRLPANESRLLSVYKMTTFPDCTSSDWFYLAVQEAANGHTYRSIGSNGDEEWISIVK